jgi:hypothetical protein
MNTPNEPLEDALRRWALGPDHRTTASAWPLTARGGTNSADDWYLTDNAHGKRRGGSPVITVWLEREWAATVLCSPSGKNPVVYVPAGTTVIEVSP